MPHSQDILSQLNKAQKQAVLHQDGPLVIFAGAGSGKTRVITTRIAYLIAQGISPWEILAVTFTNKAANEMRSRLEATTFEGKRVHVATFHSACARWLREFATQLGFGSNFLIYDDKDSTSLLKKILKEQCDKKELANLTAQIKSFIHKAKTHAILPNQVENDRRLQALPPGGIETYRRYQDALADANAMDFGDLLINTLILLRRNKSVREILQSRYRYIMIDEFQDTNDAQFELVLRLAEKHQNLCVVGDDDQSIYSWRGAKPSNIINFPSKFTNCKTIRLEENYRCTENIVRAAASLIAHNKDRAAKTLFTQNEAGDKIDFNYEADSEMEAFSIADTIVIEKANTPLNEVAIFYRTNSQSRLLEEALKRRGLTYTIYGSLAFYDRMEIKDIIAYLRLAANPKDNISFHRIVNTPTRGLGAKSIAQLEFTAEQNNLSLMEMVILLTDRLDSKIGAKLLPFRKVMDQVAMLLAEPLSDILPTLLQITDYLEFIRKRFPDQVSDKIENIHELGSAMSSAGLSDPNLNVSKWLEDISLTRDHGSDDDLDTGVSLMTLHMAKGLEYDRVYICGVEENLLPHQSNQAGKLLEEERRLFYVGITRARKKLSLYAARSRVTYNQVSVNEPSRFLLELPSELLDCPVDLQDFNPFSDELKYVEDSIVLELLPGQKVYHPTYGVGEILGVTSEFGHSKCKVHFQEFGQKKIKSSQLTPYAPHLHIDH